MGSGSSCCIYLTPQENHKLRDQNDDLNGQILSLSLYEAKNLFATQTKAQSLAAEIDTASRDEVMCPLLLPGSLGRSSAGPAPRPGAVRVRPRLPRSGEADQGLWESPSAAP